MNTLKMKVLLFLSNRYLFRSFGKAMLIWFLSNLAGCIILYMLGFFFLQSFSDFIIGLLLSLIFSSPAILVATWVLYSLPLLSNGLKKSLLSVGAILITSVIITGIVALYFHLEYPAVAGTLYPFTLSAIVCFFFIARKQIVTLKNLIN